MSPVQQRKSVKGKPKAIRVVVDCSIPATDKILDVATVEKFFHDRIKIENRTANLSANHVSITREDDKIVITEGKGQKFPKKYVKYLLKKYLKKNGTRDWLRIVSADKETYKLKYFNIAEGKEDEEESSDSDEE